MRTAQRALGLKTAGHAGTLDPMATGVLVVLLGEATKLSNLLMDHDKVYEAEVTLGALTDTLDATGELVETRAVPSLTAEEVRGALLRFVGHHPQVPPRYSALKKDGRTHMSRARAGEDFEVEARPSICHGLELLGFDPGSTSAPGSTAPRVTIRVHCGKGYYVRSLARDLAEALGTVGHLSALRRTRVGAFDIARAVPPDAVSPSQVLPIPDALPTMPHLVADGPLLEDLRCGRPASISRATLQVQTPTTVLAVRSDAVPVALVTASPDGDRLRLTVQRGFSIGRSSPLAEAPGTQGSAEAASSLTSAAASPTVRAAKTNG